MYEFGEELIIESFKVPWLIWIQLLVMILIIILLFYGFTIFSLDDDHHDHVSANAASSSTSTTQLHLVNNNNSSRLNIINNPCSDSTRVEENRNIKRDAGTSSEIVEDEVQEREGSSTKDAKDFRPPQHPCHYLGLAKQAFLKCLGFDDRKEHPKEE